MPKLRAPILAILFLVYLAFIASRMYSAGAFRSSFDNYPDEGAHFVTGLMVRAYLAEGIPAAPMAFARDFYLHYPEVAMGHWPPAFYSLEALWMLLFPPSHTAVLLLLAVLTSAIAMLLTHTAAGWCSRPMAIFGALLFLALPTTLQFTSQVMLEIPLMLFSFVAVLALIQSLERPGWQAPFVFGAAAVIAVLTKSSGWLLGPAAAFALLATGCWKSKGILRFLFPAALVLTLCLPFYLFTRRMATAGFEGRPITLLGTIHKLGDLASFLPQILGIGLLLLAITGLLIKVVLPLRTRHVENYWMALAMYIAMVFLFHAVAPTGAEPRKILMAVPALLLFSLAAVDWIARKQRVLGAIVILAVSALTILRIAPAAPGRCNVFTAPVNYLLSIGDLKNSVTLILSERSGGEGAFIAEVAEREPRPTRIILRSAKQLTSSTWNGLNYRLRYQTPEALMNALESIPVRTVVLDTEPGRLTPHGILLRRALQQFATDWDQIYSAPAPCGDGQFAIYRLKKPVTGAPGRIQIDLQDKLGTILDFPAPAARNE